MYSILYCSRLYNVSFVLFCVVNVGCCFSCFFHGEKTKCSFVSMVLILALLTQRLWCFRVVPFSLALGVPRKWWAFGGSLAGTVLEIMSWASRKRAGRFCSQEGLQMFDHWVELLHSRMTNDDLLDFAGKVYTHVMSFYGVLADEAVSHFACIATVQYRKIPMGKNSDTKHGFVAHQLHKKKLVYRCWLQYVASFTK